MRSLLAAVLAVCTITLPVNAQEAPVIGTEALAAKMSGPPANWSFTLVDARTQVEFSESHIPGSILVPARLVATKLPEVVKDKARLVVFYCNGPNCTKTVKAAKAALSVGYTNIAEYKEGLPGWGKSGRKTEGAPMKSVEVPAISPAALKEAIGSSNPPFLMDIRDAEEFDKFRIAGAVGIPLDDIAARLAEVPAGKPIVLLDHAGHQSPIAARLLAHLGRKDVKRLDGGILRWQSSGMQVVQASR
jgi:rhodanese-related sulfurtransferase